MLRGNVLLVMMVIYHQLHVNSAFVYNVGGRHTNMQESVPLRQRGRIYATSREDDSKYVDETVDDFRKSMDRRKMMNASLTGLGCIASVPAISVASDKPAVLENFGEYNLNCLLDLPPLAPNNVRLYLCRHGQTENNRLHMVQGARVDPSLNLTGKQMSLRVGGAFSMLEANLRPNFVAHSLLSRARETAQGAASVINDSFRNTGREVELSTLSSLGEVDFGPFAEGKPTVEVKSLMTKVYGAWAVGEIDTKPELGGESGREVLVRAADSLTALVDQAAKAKSGSLVAISHSTYLRMLLGLCMDISLLEAATLETKNGCINVIDVDMQKPMTKIGRNSPVFGGKNSMAPMDTRIVIPSVKVVRINETRHLADLI